MDIVGIDACPRFVTILDKLDFYSEARLVWMGMGTDAFPEELRERFDIVTASGVFLKGHIPASSMDDIHASLKPNGFFVTAMRSFYYKLGNEEGYREKLDELVRAGKLKLVKKNTFKRGVKGEVGLFVPQESTLLCYQKCK